MADEDSKLQLDESTDEIKEDAEMEDVSKTENEKEEEPEEKDEKEEKEEEEEKVEDTEDDKADEVVTPEKKAAPAKKKPKTEESTPEKPGVPLYDQPLEQSGKRDRKKVERFVQEVKKEELETSGSGTSFGDIPFIEAQIRKTQADELKVLHRVCFGRSGTTPEIKKNLFKFNGFPFTKDDKKYSQKVIVIEKIVLPELKKMLQIMGLERSGKKGEICERFINFIVKPYDTGKKPPKIKNKNKSGRGRGRPQKGSEKKTNASSSGDESSDASSSEDDDDDDDDEEEKPKKNAKKTPAKSSKTPSKTPAKKTPKKTPAKRTKAQVSDSDSESDDEPLAKKVCKPPSDAEIKSHVKKILAGANLEEVTMKTVCKQVYEHYPDFDLSHKKAFIKETVKAIIS